jgi:hypothetical protein
MIGLVSVMTINTYVGAVILNGDMRTTYAKLMEEEAKAMHLKIKNFVELDETKEYISFAIAGAISGLIIGYLWPSVFEKC